MIAKVLRGDRTAGLLRYLYGPGRHNEHHDPHLVASWDGHELDPADAPPSLRESAVTRLARRLDRPIEAYDGTVARHVWHTPVRLAPDDPPLNDHQWAMVARRLVAAGGIAPDDDLAGCRWIAVRHAEDHIHIVATLVRQDGRQPDLHGDWYRLRNEVRAIERELGLRLTSEADHTTASVPKRAEHAKAQRARPPRIPSREQLASTVRLAAIGATGEADFFDRLRRTRVEIKVRQAASGVVEGYAVAMPGDIDKAGEPIWFSGSTLAPDLSLPQVSRRWSATPPDVTATPAAAAVQPAHRRQARIEAWQRAGQAARDSLAVMRQGSSPEAAATAGAFADLMTVTAARAPGTVRTDLHMAARHLQRLGREPWREQNLAARRTRAALRAMLATTSMVGHDDENAVVLALIATATLVIQAMHAHYQATQRTAQARVARLTHDALQRAAARLPAAPTPSPPQPSFGASLMGMRPHPADPAHHHGLPADTSPSQRTDLRQAVHQAVPDPVDAEHILTDPAWPALAAQLLRIEQLGYPAGTVLAEVTAQRPLRQDLSDPARNAAHVLTWRLQNWIGEHPSTTRSTPDVPAATAPTGQDVTPTTTAGKHPRPPRSTSAKRYTVPTGPSMGAAERQFARALVEIIEAQQVSADFLASKLWMHPQAAQDLLAALVTSGAVAHHDGRYTVQISRERLPQLREAMTTGRAQAARLTSSTATGPAGQPERPAHRSATPPRPPRPRQRRGS
ncbi:hypothetical protein [Nonomuraea sp. KM90]|uniref:hypothetical protein n=1 Tax=Nonomuraea sp. KM90 TaxID=3457428 RepID=UPI003FCEBD08